MIAKFGILAIAACVYSAAAAPPPCSCGLTFEPVCAADGVTYGNDCLRRCAGAHPANAGVCSHPPSTECVCSEQYKPVCGSDGKTYNNSCYLNCAAIQNYTLGVIHTGECGDAVDCPCPGGLRPVCGSDGRIYSNECQFDCAKAQNSELTPAEEEQCDPDPILSCICSHSLLNYSPVCGSDGVTYSNVCFLNCATKQDSQLSEAHKGKCYPQPNCACTDDYKPVCGSDGKTYGNACDFNCATVQNSSLSVAHVGECGVYPQPGCECNDIYLPECGTDGNTYKNVCELDCAKLQYPELSSACSGECDKNCTVDPFPEQPDFEFCLCADIMNPVCGTDGITYDNGCKLSCAASKRLGLSEFHAGPCVSTVEVVDKSPDDSCVCDKDIEPVCGSDGKTYVNECILNCTAAKDPSLTVSREGSCVSSVKVEEPSPTPCGCNSEERDPICASDNGDRTFYNMCAFNCEKAKRPEIEFIHYGVCQCICPQNYSPVVGPDGKVYPNQCALDCALRETQK